MIFLLILVFIEIAWIEVPGLVRNMYWRELTVFSVFFLLAFLVAFLQTLGISIPDPADGIVYVIRDLLHIHYK